MKTIHDYEVGEFVTVKGVGKIWGKGATSGSIPKGAQSMVGQVCEICDIDDETDQIEIYTPDGKDTWVFHVSELEHETILPPSKGRLGEGSPYNGGGDGIDSESAINAEAEAKEAEQKPAQEAEDGTPAEEADAAEGGDGKGKEGSGGKDKGKGKGGINWVVVNFVVTSIVTLINLIYS